MKTKFLCATLVGLSAAVCSTVDAAELRVLTHSSFSLSKPLLAQFEKETGAKLAIVKAGDTGEMVNKLILTRANPIADVVYGIDNTQIGRAKKAGVLGELPAGFDSGKARLSGAVAVDYGYVTLNYDKAWFAKNKLALPKSLNELTLPAYKNLTVVENPATSSPGYAFLMSTIAGLGEDKAFAFWEKLRDNGLKVAKGWSEAYYTDFSKNGGARPIVVSYATSPAAEVFYAKDKPSEAPTGSLSLPGAVFRQVEGVALIKGGKEEALAKKFVAFLRSDAVQKDIPTSMWMYPVADKAALDPVYRHTEQPQRDDTLKSEAMEANGARYVARWTRLVLKSGN